VRRQQPRSFLAFPGFADDIVDDVSMDQAGQQYVLGSRVSGHGK
jgi:hypothetical protein